MAMADLQVMSIFTIIFTFIALDAILTSEGRSIKSAWQDELRAVNNDHVHERASQSVTPSHDHSDGRKETVLSSPAHDQAVDSGDLESVDDFHPTTPGSSPGVGHSFIGSKKEGAPPKAPSGDEERLTVTRALGDFRPGHSPGVGHSFIGSKKGGAQPKALSGDEERLTIPRTLGDFRRLHSPGVGHVFESENYEPKA